MLASRESFPLLAELLADQQRLDTPVARFAASHATGSSLVSHHSSLVPLTAPRPGEHYAFEVDLDSCTGCKSCVAACHALNGLDDTETWRDVGLLVSPDPAHPFTQTVTTACHHCADPGCLNGCPVLAYEKDPLTGIVRHLDDQCIGCSYCILKCPYDVPKYSTRLGIVRKCDLCHGRLAAGEAPACAQSCPTHAIRIVTVPAPSASAAGPATAVSPAFLPGAPDPSYTRPTTRYVGTRPLPADLLAADATALRPQPPHWPLVALLTLMPLAVGCGVADLCLPAAAPALAATGWLAGVAGLGLSVLHLGQPLRAWRVFLGLRRSWLSREAVAFGAWLPLASAATAVRLGWIPLETGAARTALAVAASAVGVIGLFCSVMVYVDTRREFWRLHRTAPRFFGSAVILGLSAAVAAAPAASVPILAALLAAATIAKLLLESRAHSAPGPRSPFPSPAVLTARLLVGPLRAATRLRLAAATLGAMVLPALLAVGLAPAWLAWPALLCTAAGELAERYLFFRAVDAPKMPGQPAASPAAPALSA